MSLANFRKDIYLEFYNEAGQLVIAYKIYRCWVSEYQALPDLDANANAIAIEHIKLENEGWERDTGVTEPQEPTLSYRGDLRCARFPAPNSFNCGKAAGRFIPSTGACSRFERRGSRHVRGLRGLAYRPPQPRALRTALPPASGRGFAAGPPARAAGKRSSSNWTALCLTRYDASEVSERGGDLRGERFPACRPAAIWRSRDRADPQRGRDSLLERCRLGGGC